MGINLNYEIDQEFRRLKKDEEDSGGMLYKGTTQAEADAERDKAIASYRTDIEKGGYFREYSKKDLAKAEATRAVPEGALREMATAIASEKVAARKAQLDAMKLKSKKKPSAEGGGGE